MAYTNTHTHINYSVSCEKDIEWDGGNGDKGGNCEFMIKNQCR